MALEPNYIKRALLVLGVGAIGAVTFAAIYLQMWQWKEPFSRIFGDLGLVVVPMVVFAVAVGLLRVWFGRFAVARAAFIRASVVVGFGALLYARLVLPFPADRVNPDSYEPNLVFIFAPFYQLAAAVCVAVVCGVIGYWRRNAGVEK